MALVLALLLAWAFTGDKGWAYGAMAALVLNMTWPAPYKPLARLWLGLSALLGAVMSKVILAVVFFGLVTPLALVRRALGHDPMRGREWKKSPGTVFVTRDHVYQPQEIERPF